MLRDCDTRRWSGAVLVCSLLLLPAAAVSALNLRLQVPPNGMQRESRQDGRMRPPSVVTCDRNNLTSYTGSVISYSRLADRINLSIKTDSDTTESVSLRFPRNSGPWRWFLFDGRPFDRHDWKKIELSKGKLYPGMRVSAWVCTDGRKPILDWHPSTGNETAPPGTP